MIEKPSSAGLEDLSRQFWRFAAVGVIHTPVHFGILIALVEWGHVHPVWATTAGFVTAVLVSYVLNRRYTFEEQTTSFYAGLLKYYAAVSMGLVINAGTMAALTKVEMHYLPAQVIASGLALVWNFLAARYLVFRR